MYLLKRTISPYTNSDLLLGCFQSIHEAETAREHYIARYKEGEVNDPWKGQAFRTVDLDQDVALLEDIPEYAIQSNCDTVFVISSFAEGFGQDRREFHAICGSVNVAQIKIAELKKSFAGQWPRYYDMQQIVVSQLLSDDKDRLHIGIHINTLRELKKLKNFRRAEQWLVDLIEDYEIKSAQDGLGVAPWYYFELAKLYRKRKNYSKEARLLERFAAQNYVKPLYSPGATPSELLERLSKVKELLVTKPMHLK